MHPDFWSIFTDTLKTLLRYRFAVLATATLGTINALSPASATTFNQQEVEQDKFIALAVPRVAITPQLVILEQISNSRPCWTESGINPVTVEPLLVNFDFTGICGRSTDINGYSIRMAGQDLVMLYNLKIVKQNDELVLIGTSNTDPNAPVLEIGRTYGISSGVSKIVLEKSWRFTKRTFNGQTLGHIYLTSDLATPIAHPEQQGIGAIPIRTGSEMFTSSRSKNPTAPAVQPTSSPSTPSGYPTAPTGYPPQTNMNPSVLSTSNPSQPVSPFISAQINAALAAKGLTLASCSAAPGVVVMIGSYMACAYPTDVYPPGRYSLAF